MVRTDEKIVAALVNLDADSDFNTIRNWIKTSFAAQLVDNVALRGEEATRGQGYAEALQDIQSIIEDPRKLAEKFKK